MNKLLVLFLLLFSLSAEAYQIFQGPPAGKMSETSVSVDYYGGFQLKQDLIDNLHSSQPTRRLAFTFGRNSLVQNVLCDLWEGPTCTYVFPATAQQMLVLSSSASDTLAGTGARTVTIDYLDSAYAQQQTTVDLNGTSAVLTAPTGIFRINGFYVSAVSSGGSAAGNISLQNTAGTVTYGYIVAGNNTARQAVFTVPAGVHGYISHWQASSGSASGNHFTRISIRATAKAGVPVPGVMLVVDEVGTLNGGQSANLPIPIRIPPTTDVKLSAISDAPSANVVAMGAIMGWLETQQ